jgi:cytochrome c biogenesis protein CcmG, thiol:disulfide interchange protein DsbE
MAEGRGSRTVLVVSLVVGIVLVGFVALLAVSAGGDDDTAASALIGEAAPPVVGTSLDGEPFDIDDHRGKWVLVNYFATWCPPCVEEHPELIAFDEAHADAGDVELVSVVFDDNEENVRTFFENNGGDWPVLVEGTDGVAVSWGVLTVPETFLVSPQGIVVHRFTGGVTQEDLESVLAEARGTV